jgi:outer membrane protein assembly factor BamB
LIFFHEDERMCWRGFWPEQRISCVPRQQRSIAAAFFAKRFAIDSQFLSRNTACGNGLPRIQEGWFSSIMKTGAMLKTILAFTTALAIAQSATAEQWPQFRGPTGQGISTEKNLPLHWNAESNIVWKTAIPGEGWSSPIIWSGRVFLTATTEDGTQCHVICVDRASGKIAWDKQVLEQVPLRKETKNSHATPTPVTDGERVYAVFSDGSIVALDMEGSLLWINRDVKHYSRHGLGASPILYRNLLIMPYDGSNRVAAPGNWPNNTAEERLGWQIPWDKAEIVALDVKTGKRVWTAKRGLSRIAHVTPLLVDVDGKDQLISGAGDRIQGFDPKTGELIWSVYSQGEGVSPSPVIAEGLVIAPSGFEKTTLRAVRLGGAKGDVTESHIAWEQTRGVPNQSSPIYVKPYVYGVTDGGIVNCFDPRNGEVIYQERIGGTFSASPVSADGRIYFLSESGETIAVKPGKDFEVLARNPLNERCQASMAVANGQLLIRSDKHLYCIGLP